ncbi:hypothetical protein VKT23_001150 [Stygiomarasmius scandens]|uniref:Uncharacterized protein n=1 Tax=Marasmiellus scandens TaxID=2682957 RepID=A0ABR1K873_9AGAR
MGDVFREDELVELIAEIYRVDVVAFQVGEHDDLERGKEQGQHHQNARQVEGRAKTGELVKIEKETHEKDHAEQQSCSHEDREQE